MLRYSNKESPCFRGIRHTPKFLITRSWTQDSPSLLSPLRDSESQTTFHFWLCISTRDIFSHREDLLSPVKGELIKWRWLIGSLVCQLRNDTPHFHSPFHQLHSPTTCTKCMVTGGISRERFWLPQFGHVIIKNYQGGNI